MLKILHIIFNTINAEGWIYSNNTSIVFENLEIQPIIVIISTSGELHMGPDIVSAFL